MVSFERSASVCSDLEDGNPSSPDISLCNGPVDSLVRSADVDQVCASVESSLDSPPRNVVAGK
jgi:hypothetical protein